MKNFLSVICAAALLLSAIPAEAEMCALDNVPAATLLLPYFEVSPVQGGVTTLFSLNNSSADAALTHVTLWTDWSLPTVDFDVYLTGYDVVTVNLYDLIWLGNIPITADDNSDPDDDISPQGPVSQDVTFPGCFSIFPFFVNPVIRGGNLERVQDGHTGNPVSTLGANACLGHPHGDGLARGYITIDNVNGCSTLFADDPGYFIDGGLGIASDENQLWGDYFIVDPANNFAFGDALVHIEADPLFNALSTPTGYTFYGRYTAPSGFDNREPLGTAWAVRYLQGGGFDGGTDLIVWRDSTEGTVAPSYACNAAPPWYPLNETQVVAFDEEENPTVICFEPGGGVISPPENPEDPLCFPLETGRYHVGDEGLTPPANFGWMYLNLNHVFPGGELTFPYAQSYVTRAHNASGRFQVGLQAVEMAHACDPSNVFLPIFP